MCEEAKLERDTDWIGKMDPWCQVDTEGGQSLRTRTLNGAGKTPVWQQAFYLQINDNLDEQVTLSVWDEDRRNHDLVGEKIYRISDWLKEDGGELDDWFPVDYKGR